MEMTSPAGETYFESSVSVPISREKEPAPLVLLTRLVDCLSSADLAERLRRKCSEEIGKLVFVPLPARNRFLVEGLSDLGEAR